jgi:pyrroline-5-carboxylate reductase
MGIAIMSGVLAHLEDRAKRIAIPPPAVLVDMATPSEDLPTIVPGKFIACVRRRESAKHINDVLGRYGKMAPLVYVNENLRAVREGDVCLLGCKPQMFRDVLDEPGIKDALAGKLLISILADVDAAQVERHLYGDAPPPPNACRVVHAMPNTAAFVRESMTVVATPSPPLPPEWDAFVGWLFSRVGRVARLPPGAMDASTALCGAGPAFAALVLEALADGAVAMGLPRAEAQLMAAQVLVGAGALVAGGEHPAILRDKVSTPGGCTIGGLLVLEDGRVRGSVARAVREATVIAGQLGKGVVGVNGTRFPPAGMD